MTLSCKFLQHWIGDIPVFTISMLGAKINFEKIEKLQILGALLKCETVKTLNFTGNAQFLRETLETSWGWQGSEGHVQKGHFGQFFIMRAQWSKTPVCVYVWGGGVLVGGWCVCMPMQSREGQAFHAWFTTGKAGKHSKVRAPIKSHINPHFNLTEN